MLINNVVFYDSNNNKLFDIEPIEYEIVDRYNNVIKTIVKNEYTVALKDGSKMRFYARPHKCIGDTIVFEGIDKAIIEK